MITYIRVCVQPNARLSFCGTQGPGCFITLMSIPLCPALLIAVASLRASNRLNAHLCFHRIPFGHLAASPALPIASVGSYSDNAERTPTHVFCMLATCGFD